MCGILGFKSTNKNHIPFIYKIIEQSQIRGKHATGVSYISKGNLISIVDPISAKIFLGKYWNKIYEDLLRENEISFIGHTRYSTSGIEHNQPIYDEELSLVMNGVITQANPKRWNFLFGTNCKTSNDTEIAWEYLKKEKEPLKMPRENFISIACCALYKNGELKAFRNGKRPAYGIILNSTTTIIGSTKNILKRAVSVSTESFKLLPGNIYNVYPGYVQNKCIKKDCEEWQE